MDVSIIMINYNTFELAKDAIESIIQHTSSVSYELILIDNNSPDGSGEKLKKYFVDKIIFIQSSDNLGTSKAFNLGLKQAKGKYVLWLNTDILIKENFIYKLFDYMEKNPNCGICGGNVLDFNGNPTHSYMKKLPSLKTVKDETKFVKRLIKKILKKVLSDQYNFSNKSKEVGYVTGADMMIRKSVFNEIGDFNEEIFMYGEETEFTFRMKKNTDYKVISVPYAYIYHLEGASFSGTQANFNKRRFTTYLNGLTIYYRCCYGTEAVSKYYLLEIRNCKRYMCVYKFLNNKNRYDEFKNKLIILEDYYKKLKNKD